MPFSLAAVAVIRFLFRVSASFALTEGQKKSHPTTPFPSHVHSTASCNLNLQEALTVECQAGFSETEIRHRERRRNHLTASCKHLRASCQSVFAETRRPSLPCWLDPRHIAPPLSLRVWGGEESGGCLFTTATVHNLLLQSVPNLQRARKKSRVSVVSVWERQAQR